LLKIGPKPAKITSRQFPRQYCKIHNNLCYLLVKGKVDA